MNANNAHFSFVIFEVISKNWSSWAPRLCLKFMLNRMKLVVKTKKLTFEYFSANLILDNSIAFLLDLDISIRIANNRNIFIINFVSTDNLRIITTDEFIVEF